MKIGDLAPRPPQKLRTEQDIIASWIGDVDKPLVSIRCATFNHVDYIRDAIHGFLSQETDFPFGVVIHDDASTDGTADIVRDYERRYPRIIKGIYQEKNLFSEGISRDRYVRPLLRGKYVAVCEGDDYWIDPRKLQIQVGFLEENPEFTISGHDAFICDEEGHIKSLSKLPDEHKKDFESEDLINGRAWILTMSWVYRNTDIPTVPESRFIVNGDTFFLSRIGWFGKSKYHADIRPAAYRRHGGGIWSAKSIVDQRSALTASRLWIGCYYRRIGKPEVASSFVEQAGEYSIGFIDTRVLVKELRARLALRRRIMTPLRRFFGR